jgi:cobalt-zinc-cadmium efflux system protein
VAQGHHHHHHPAQAGTDRRWLALALALIVAFMAGEVVVGLLAHSLALLSDAGHMLTDAGAIVFALVAIRLAAHPPRGGYTFGLKRAEILAAQANGLTLLLLSAGLTVEAVRRLVHPPPVAGAAVLVTALVGIAVSAAAAWAIGRANRSSLNIEGAFQHVLTDLFAFVATAVAGLVVLLTGFARADGLATLVVVGLMVRSGVGLLRESGRIFLEAAPAGVDPAALGGRLAGLPGVVEVHDLHVWQVTSGYPAMSAHVLVDEYGDCHAARVTIEELLRAEYAIEHTTLQVDHAPPSAPGTTADAARAGDDPHCVDPHGATYRSDSTV